MQCILSVVSKFSGALSAQLHACQHVQCYVRAVWMVAQTKRLSVPACARRRRPSHTLHGCLDQPPRHWELLLRRLLLRSAGR